MRTIRNGMLGASLAASLAAAALIVGCGDDDDHAGQPDSGQPVPDAAKPDSSQPIDSGTDTGTEGDASIPNVQPKVVALSTGGHDSLYGVTFDAAGNIYAVGRHTDAVTTGTDVQSIVVKFKADGTLDTTFGTDGIAKVNLIAGAGAEFARGIVIQSTGKIVIGALAENAGNAKDRDVYLARFLPNGKIDDASDFGTAGIVTLDLGTGEAVDGAVVAVDNHWGLSLTQGDGLVVTGATKRIGGTDTDFAVVKLDAKGAKDPAFAVASPDHVFRLDPNAGDYHPSASPRNATILADGSIVVAGYQTEQSGVVVPVVFKLSSAGVLDTTFGSGGVFKEPVLTAISEVYGAAPQGTSFVTAGYGNNTGETTRDWLSIRVRANGTRDLSYGTGAGFTRIDVAGETDNARAVTVLPDERVVLVGGTRAAAGSKTHATIGVLSKNGVPDESFGPKGLRTFDLGGAGDFFWATAVSPDKKTLATVGLLGGVSDGGDDDAALLILPLP